MEPFTLVWQWQSERRDAVVSQVTRNWGISNVQESINFRDMTIFKYQCGNPYPTPHLCWHSPLENFDIPAILYIISYSTIIFSMTTVSNLGTRAMNRPFASESGLRWGAKIYQHQPTSINTGVAPKLFSWPSANIVDASCPKLKQAIRTSWRAFLREVPYVS